MPFLVRNLNLTHVNNPWRVTLGGGSYRECITCQEKEEESIEYR